MSGAQGRPGAAARLAALPLLASVGAKLSDLYAGTKRSHPGLRRVCEGLENGVTAVLSPVIATLEPPISIANEFACKGLDWLETAFPVLHTPTEQLVASAKTKMAELQDLVSVAANAPADCVSLGVSWLAASWLAARLEGAQDRGRPLVDRAVETALATSEALVDRMLPPAEDDRGKTEVVQRSEVTLQSSLERLFELATKLYRRTVRTNCRSTWIQTMLELPGYLKHQLVSAVVFLSQTHDCSANTHQRLGQPNRRRAPEIRYMDSPKTAAPSCRLRKPTFDSVCSVKGCVDR